MVSADCSPWTAGLERERKKQCSRKLIYSKCSDTDVGIFPHNVLGSKICLGKISSSASPPQQLRDAMPDKAAVTGSGNWVRVLQLGGHPITVRTNLQAARQKPNSMHLLHKTKLLPGASHRLLPVLLVQWDPLCVPRLWIFLAIHLCCQSYLELHCEGPCFALLLLILNLFSKLQATCTPCPIRRIPVLSH